MQTSVCWRTTSAESRPGFIQGTGREDHAGLWMMYETEEGKKRLKHDWNEESLLEGAEVFAKDLLQSSLVIFLCKC